METTGLRGSALLHEKKVASLLDYLGDVALLPGGEPGDAARQDFTGVRNEAGKDFHIRVCQLQRVLVALFLSCHKRSKEGT